MTLAPSSGTAMASAWAGMACPALVVTDSAESWPAGSRALPGHVGSPRATAVATAHERDPVVEIHEAGAFPEGSSYDGCGFLPLQGLAWGARNAHAEPRRNGRGGLWYVRSWRKLT